MGEEADRAAVRAALRKAHETNAESQYPKWNEHTERQIKELKKQHDKKTFKSDTLEYYLLFTFFPNLKKYHTVEDMRKARAKSPAVSSAQNATNARAAPSAKNAAPDAPPALSAAAGDARTAGDGAAGEGACAPTGEGGGGGGGAGGGAAGEGDGGAGAGDGAGDPSIRVVDPPAPGPVAARAAADDAEIEARSSADESAAGAGAASPQSKSSKPRARGKKIGRSTSVASHGRPKRKVSKVSDAAATESDNASPKKIRRRPSKGDARKGGDDGDLEQQSMRRTSRHFSKNDSQILLEYKSFESMRSKFQQRIWARDGYYRKDGAIDRKLNLQNLLLTAEEVYDRKTFREIKAAFDRAMQDPTDQ